MKHGLLAACLALTFFCAGCGSESSGGTTYEDFNFGSKESSYGEVLYTDDTYGILTEYDRDFLDSPEIEALDKYFLSIQNGDTDAFNQCTADFYMDYYLENAYDGLLDSAAFVERQRGVFADLLSGDDFTFSELFITDCMLESNFSSADSVDSADSTSELGIPGLQQMCIELSGQDYFDEHWNGCKLLHVEAAVTDSSETAVSEEMTIFVVHLDDGYYICP